MIMIDDKGYEFNLPQTQDAIIKVIGVGGGGSNAVNYMYSLGIQDVEFLVCNTDKQALFSSAIPTKLQIGVTLTGGLGAGASPQKGREAALENAQDIQSALGDTTKMLFITAGMGGGTGTGAAPEIARIAQEMGILTVGIVTMPFVSEGTKKMRYAEEGVSMMKENCDTVLVVLNERLRDIYGKLTISEAFAKADDILTRAAKGIAEIITYTGKVNVDFEDVNTVMREAGEAVMGSGFADGEDRALRAVQQAINSPLLNTQYVKGAKKILLSIASSEKGDPSMDEYALILDYVNSQLGEDPFIIWGKSTDERLGDGLSVMLVATGFPTKKSDTTLDSPSKRVFDLGSHAKDKEEAYSGFHTSVYEKAPVLDESADVNEDSSPISFSVSPPPSSSSPEVSLEKEEAKPAPPSEEEKHEEEDKEVGDKVEAVSSPSSKESDTFSVRKDPLPIQQDPLIDDLQGASLPFHSRQVLESERQEREKQILGNERNRNTVSAELYNMSLDNLSKEPAYQRRKVQLEKSTSSMQRNLSDLVLDSEKKMVKKNSFFHDNVD